uniref:DUF834 domain-containing protein n=2 Tax=Oryza TaxID=4527 RepID=A0A0E0N8T3_ORYRU
MPFCSFYASTSLQLRRGGRNGRAPHVRLVPVEDGVLKTESTAVVKAEAAEVEERRAELVADAAGEGLGAFDDDAALGGVRDGEVVGEEGEDRAEVGADAGGKEPPGAPSGCLCRSGDEAAATGPTDREQTPQTRAVIQISKA